jgi:hypothetical protein
MLIETTVTLFVAGFVAISLYGHLLLAQAFVAAKDS